jgi:hypothetical protein
MARPFLRVFAQLRGKSLRATPPARDTDRQRSCGGVDVPVVIFGLPAHAVGVVHPVNSLPGQVVQRQTVFDAVRPVLRAGDDPGLDLHHEAAAEPEFQTVQTEQKIEFVIRLPHIALYQDWMS